MKFLTKKSMFQKIIVAALIMAIALQLRTVDAQAATVSWNLRYIRYAPTTEQKSSWEKTVTTTSTTTKMKINQVGGGAVIWVYTSNGIAAMFDGPGSIKITKREKGKKIVAQVKYQVKGSSTNYPSGEFTY